MGTNWLFNFNFKEKHRPPLAGGNREALVDPPSFDHRKNLAF